MRTPIILALMAAVAVPSIAQAQSLREARESQRDVREEQRDLREARHEARADWRDYRRSHRDAYRRPAYVGPRGYAYRPVAVGHRFDRAYYGSRYVISDPWRYRLPAVHGAHRWVRYGNDALLVNIRNGRVLEVYNDFFW